MEGFMMEDFQSFKWLNQSGLSQSGGILTIKSHPKSDFFIDPAGAGTVHNAGYHSAAYFYTEAEGDFVLKAKVSHSFIGVYDACAFMVMGGDTTWAKLCFELTDIGTHSVVSVVTNGVSDDANGVDINGNTVYLQLVKKGGVFAMHYSLDGTDYKMVRYFSLPITGAFKIGLVAQSPLGDSAEFTFEEISLKYITVENMRKGV